MSHSSAKIGEVDADYVERARSGAKRLRVRGEGPDLSRDALADLEDTLPLDIDPPTQSARAATGAAKSAIKRLGRWYFAYLATQVTALGEATLRLGTSLADRVDALDEGAKEQAARIDDLELRLQRLEPAAGDRQ